MAGTFLFIFWMQVKLSNDEHIIHYSVNGKRYFDCPPKYGSMVPIKCVTVGDYPPEEYNLDEEL